MKNPIKVLIADRDEASRQRLCALLEEANGIAVVGVASDGREAIGMMHEIHCDVMLVDVDTFVPTLRQAAAQSRELPRDTRIIVLSGDNQEQQVIEALRNGAMGHVHRTSARAEIVQAIQAVSRGEAVMTSAVAGCILDRVTQRQ
jgi:DNA-binding NarL/FixJ family response regulator